jgi:hypothetical protein
MNILVDRLPEAIRIGEDIHPIDPDFRNCIRIMLAYEDNELTPNEKQSILVHNLYTDPNSLKDYHQAAIKAIKFLNGGDEILDEGTGISVHRLYSFSKDSKLIFAAFQQTHDIDLQNVDFMHWWKFMALFMDLGSETLFCSIVALRKRVHDGKASVEEKRMYYEMEDLFKVPDIDTRTVEQKEHERDFMERVQRAMAKRDKDK